jgi:hypothetical protein
MAAIYIEAAFALPGIGTQALQAQVGFLGLDLPVIVGVVTVVATAVIIANVVADIIAARPIHASRRAADVLPNHLAAPGRGWPGRVPQTPRLARAGRRIPTAWR